MATPLPQPAMPGAQPSPLKGFKLVLGTFALAMGSFMNILDMSIANVSLPTIAGDFAVTPTQGTWVITSYAVSEAIFLPLTGWISKRIGDVRQFIFATLLFTLASILCGAAPSFGTLIFARVLQGIVGASMIPLSQALIMKIYPPAKRGMALGIWATTTIIAPVLGPLIGGWLTDNLVWRWAFYINLPFGLVTAYAVYWIFGMPKTVPSKEKIDTVGLVLLIITVSSLQIMLDKGNELDWFSSRWVVALSLASFIAGISFIIWELGCAHPVVDLRLFKFKNFAVAASCLFFGSFAFYVYIVIGPLWLQTQLGYTAFQAGKVMAMTGALALICGPLFGANIHRVDARFIATVGFFAMAVGCYWASTFTTTVDVHSLMVARLVMGVGIAGFFMPMTAISMSALKPQQLAAGSGLTNFLRNMGGSIGTAISTTLWQDNAARHHARLIENINIANPVYQQFSSQASVLGLDGQPQAAVIDQLITSQAYLLSTNQLMILSAVVLLSLLPLIWVAKPPFSAGKGAH